MNNAASAADLIDTAASLAEDEALSRALSEVDDLAGHAAEGPAEVSGNLLAALAYLLTVARGEARALGECAAIYERASAVVWAWRLDLGAESWADAPWSPEVEACCECADRLHTLRAALLDASAGRDGAVYARICRAA